MTDSITINNAYEFAKESQDFFKKIKIINDLDFFLRIGWEPDIVTGGFCEERVNEVVDFCKKNPDYHIVSRRRSLIFNCFRRDGELFYIANGDRNPKLAYDFGFAPMTVAQILKIAEFYVR